MNIDNVQTINKEETFTSDITFVTDVDDLVLPEQESIINKRANESVNSRADFDTSYPHKNNINIFHQNVQSLSNKTGILEKIIVDKKLDVLCITEHWMTNAELEVNSILKHLQLVTGYCRSIRIHGGVAIYSKYISSEYKVLNYFNNISVELDCELAGVEFLDIDTIVIAVYRSPQGNFETFFRVMELALSYLNKKNRKTILCGDFNLHFNAGNKDAECFVNLCCMYGFEMKVHEPTRGTNCLDNVFSSFQENLNVQVSNCHVSDHLGQLISIVRVNNINDYKKQKLLTTTAKTYKNLTKINEGNINIFRFHLLKESWSEIFCNYDVDISFNKFLNSVRYYYDLSFVVNKRMLPKSSNGKLNNNNNKLNWYTPDLKNHKNRLDFLYFLYKTSPEYRNLYIREKSLYRLSIREAKKVANRSIIENSQNKTKALWRIVNKNRSEKNQFPPKVITPDTFNYFFANIADEIKNKLIKNDNVTAADLLENKKVSLSIGKFSFKPISENCVMEVVKHMSPKNSKDHYGLSNALIKRVIDCIVAPFTVLINEVIAKGKFPTSLKITKVIPVFKKGKHDEITNYRPIALVPILSKIIEIILGKQLCKFLESNNLLCETQFGFRKGLSTTHALIKLVEEIIVCFEEKNTAAVSFCDLSRAFECVPHDILLAKLKHLHVERPALELLSSYLRGRTQYVCADGRSSGVLPIKCGVPQGSVLGPLLFIIMIDDLSINVPSKVLLYADDTTVLNKHKDDTEAVTLSRNNLKVVQNWLNANELFLNEDKTKTVTFELRSKPTSAKTEKVQKFLGIMIDSSLSWTQHISSLKSKLSSSVFALKRLCGELEQDGLRQAYFGLFQSHMSYGLIVWGCASHAKDIFIIQKRAIRVIAGVQYREHCRDIFINLRILTLYSLYIMQCLLYLRINVDKMKMRSTTHSHNTRSSHLLNVNRSRLHKTDQSPTNAAVKLMNRLPIEVRQLGYKRFKQILELFFLSNPFYSVKEFFDKNLRIGDFKI